MARSGPGSRPGRALGVLLALLAVIFGSIAAGAVWSDAQWTPKLALDLEGGTQIVLTPVPEPGNATKMTTAKLNEAVNIIRQRVDGAGTSEAEITTLGQGTNRSISVSLPGKPDEKTLQLVKQSAELNFRPVLVAAATGVAATPTPTPTPSASASPSASSTKKSTAGPTASSTSKSIIPGALTKAAAATESPAAASSAAATGDAASDPSADPSAEATTGSTPGAADPAAGTASDTAQITEALEKKFTAETCTDLEAIQLTPVETTKPIVTCETDGSAKYILGPVEVRGSTIKNASSGLGTTSQGFSNGEWTVTLDFNGTGTKQFAAVTERLAALTGYQNQFAIVLDNLVVSAPTTNERIPGGQAQITGNFTQESAQQLASQLKFGSLPVTFRVETEQQISATLGKEQLERGLLAGLIGLGLVVVYSLLQYRALGLVTVFSLVIAGLLNFGLVVLLSWQQGYRLSLPGVTGLIVSIGVTADSFIVYFERIRDEVRDGRPLRAAVETAWVRARRTILVSDTVSLLAAVVLYLLAVGGVRGFAFTLGLTTVIDVIVVFLFTKPMVTVLSRTKFFDGGHPLSGFSPEQLGRSAGAATYAGRGRIRSPGASTIAERRAAAQAGEDGDPEYGSPDEAGGREVRSGSSSGTSGSSGRDL